MTQTKGTRERYNKVVALIDQGFSVQEALKKAKIGAATYYKFKNSKTTRPNISSAPPATKKPRKTKQENSKKKAVVVLCDMDDLCETLKAFK